MTKEMLTYFSTWKATDTVIRWFEAKITHGDTEKEKDFKESVQHLRKFSNCFVGLVQMISFKDVEIQHYKMQVGKLESDIELLEMKLKQKQKIIDNIEL